MTNSKAHTRRSGSPPLPGLDEDTSVSPPPPILVENNSGSPPPVLDQDHAVLKTEDLGQLAVAISRNEANIAAISEALAKIGAKLDELAKTQAAPPLTALVHASETPPPTLSVNDVETPTPSPAVNAIETPAASPGPVPPWNAPSTASRLGRPQLPKTDLKEMNFDPEEQPGTWRRYLEQFGKFCALYDLDEPTAILNLEFRLREKASSVSERQARLPRSVFPRTAEISPGDGRLP